MGEPTTSRPEPDDDDVMLAFLLSMQDLRARAETAEAEVERLRAARDRMIAVLDAFDADDSLSSTAYEVVAAARAALDPDVVGGQDA